MVQYLTNEKGKKKAVVVPIEEWESIQAELRKHEVLESLRRGYMEMQEMEKKGIKGKSWQELIQELRDDAAV